MLRSAVNYVKKAVGLTTAYEYPELVYNGPTASGVNVNSETALRVPAVKHAVTLIAEAVGGTSCKLYAHAEGKQTADDHRAYRIVHDWANKFTSAGHLRVELTTDAMLHGFGVAHVRRRADKTPHEIRRLNPGSVQRCADEDGVPFFVMTAANRQRVRVPYTDMIYVPSFGARSMIADGKEAIAVSLNLEKHAAELFGRGAQPAAILTNSNAALGGESKGTVVVNKLMENFLKWQEKVWPILPLDNGWTYQPVTMNSTDAQFIENRRFQIDEIARIFGVPPTMLFELSRGTWSNTEQMSINFRQMALKPWFERWQAAYAIALLSEDELDSHYVEFSTDDVQNTDIGVRTATLTKLIASRVMTPNEAREKLNMAPVPGGDELMNPHITTNAPAPSEPSDKEPKNV